MAIIKRLFNLITKQLSNNNLMSIEIKNEGYVSWFLIPDIPGIIRLDASSKNPNERLNDLNNSPDSLYMYEIGGAKYVDELLRKKNSIDFLLREYRIYPDKDFFQVSEETIRQCFNLIDEKVETLEEEKEIIPTIEEEDEVCERVYRKKCRIYTRGCRTLWNCFRNGQRIRHKILIPAENRYDERIAVYNNNEIIWNGRSFGSMSGFAENHYKEEKPDRVSADGWKECEYELNNEWVSTYNLPHSATGECGIFN